MHVVVIGHTARLSGGELALARLVSGFDDSVRVDVVLGEAGPLVDALEAAGARMHVHEMASGVREVRKGSLGLRGLRWRTPVDIARTVVGTVRHVARLRRVIAALEPDVVHTNTLKAAVYGGLAARLARRPVVWHVRDRIAPDYLPRPAVAGVRALSRVVPHAVIGNSRATLATVPGRSGGTRVVVHSPAATSCASTRTPRAGGTPFRVGVVGRLAAWKGQHVFLEAFARAFPDGDERAVVVGSAMFGEDDYADRLATLATSLGLAERVELRGFRHDVPAELARLDVLVHCSVVPEPFGQVVIEGMAAGLPVAAADAGGPAEIVRDGVDGLLVPPGDVAALAGALRRLRDDPALRLRIGSTAAASVEAYRPPVIAAQAVEVYADVLRRRKAGVASHLGSQPRATSEPTRRSAAGLTDSRAG